MKIKVLLISISLLAVSCKSTKSLERQDVVGEYYYTGKDSKTRIDFKSSGTFTFWENNLGVIRECNGEWSLKSDTIFYSCNNENADLKESLSSGFIEKMNGQALFLSKGKIKIGGRILKKKKK